VPRKPCLVGGVKGHNINEISFPGSPALWTGSFIGGYDIGIIEGLDTICREIQSLTHHIETSLELNPRWLSRREKIGLTATGSTPLWIIKEVEKRIRYLVR